jgi:cell division protein FtsQ
MGFVVKNIDVLGDDHVREQDVLMAIGVYRGDYLFALDVEAAQDRVEALSWVDRAVVRRLWPNRIVVQLHEVREAGLWQYQGNVQVVDYNGNAITEADAAEFTYLPLLVGEKAGENIAQVNRVIDTYPDLASRVDAFVHFPSGRWDLHLDGGNMQVKLPKEGMEAAIVRLLKLHRDKKILDRQIGIIDLRLADRLSLTPQTAEPA